MTKPSKDDAFSVSDSTDWLPTPLSSLAAVDSALRCQVCKDFYTTPMITSCSHTFCSICIRRCLNNDGKCPACRAQDQEMKLRFNGAMEEMVEAFKRAREEVLEFARREVDVKPVDGGREKTPKRSREAEGEGGSPRKRTRSGGRRMQSSASVVIRDSDEEDGDYTPEDGYVNCPLCSKHVKLDSINVHMDNGCPDESKKATKSSGRTSKNSTQNAFPISDKPIKRPDRLPQVNYSMIKEAVLRKKLTDMGVSAAGTRPLLERRYTEWITLWNANCDATRPKSKFELKRELETWERTQGGRAQVHSSSSGPQIKDKDFDGQSYSTSNNDSFRDLIAQARKKVAVKAPTEETVGVQSPVAAESPTTRREAGGEMDISEEVTSPVLKSGSQGRFFEESKHTVKSSQRPSSQFSSSLTLLDKDSGIAPDVSELRPVQS